MRILAALADKTGCGYYRMMLPLNELARRGLAEVVWGGNVDARDFDIIIGQRASNVQPHSEWMRLANHRDRNYRLVFEIDDDLWHIERSNKSAWDYYAMDVARLERLSECAMVSDLVTCTTEPLARVVRKITNAPVVVIPNCIDKAVLNITRKPCDQFTIGNGGSASHVGDWAAESAGIGNFLRRHQDTIMHFIGAEFTNHLPGSVISQVRMTPWKEVGREYFESLIMDVGVAPLKPCVFNNSKSHLKVLEFQGLGIVPVVSDSPAYHDTIKDGKDGFLCASPKEWYYALQTLRDKDTRDEMAEAGRKRAAGQTVQGQCRRWLTAYQQAMERPVGG